MKKVIVILIDFIAVLVIIAIAFAAGYCFCNVSGDEVKEVVVSDNEDDIDLELPMEVEKRVITVEEVETKLTEIGELSTYSGKYTYTMGKDEERYCFEKIPVPGTTNSITITCDGVVKVGYNISDILVEIEDDKIYISIPEAYLNDNYVIWDSLKCDEVNNIFNPIEFSQYHELIDEIEQKGLEQVEERGIYKEAEDNLKILINAFLSEFDDYEIVYL